MLVGREEVLIKKNVGDYGQKANLNICTGICHHNQQQLMTVVKLVANTCQNIFISSTLIMETFINWGPRFKVHISSLLVNITISCFCEHYLVNLMLHGHTTGPSGLDNNLVQH